MYDCTYVQCTSLELEPKTIPEKSKSAYLGSFQLNPIPMNKHKIKLNPLVEQRWNSIFFESIYFYHYDHSPRLTFEIK